MSAVLQTIIVHSLCNIVAAPLILPKIVEAARRIWTAGPSSISPIRSDINNAGVARSTISNESDISWFPQFRLTIATLGLLLFTYIAIFSDHNIFLLLAPSTGLLQNIFPVLRVPLDVRLPSDLLGRKWAIKQGKELSEDQVLLLARLQTLNARKAYIAHGPAPLLFCSWCKNAAVDDVDLDYLAYNAPTIILSYVIALTAAGILLSGRRARWRSWAVSATIVCGTFEMYMRYNWNGIRGITTTMIHSQLHALRHMAFIAILVLSYLAPISEEPSSPSTAEMLAPALISLAQQTEIALHRIRLSSIERMSLMMHGDSRKKIVNFWSAAEAESEVANSDPVVQRAREDRSTKFKESDESMKAWLEQMCK